MTTPAKPADPVAPMWRAAVLLRVITLFFAAGVVVTHYDEYARPNLAVGAVCAMALWTAVSARHYLSESNRQLWFTIADLAVCCGVMAMSRLILTYEQRVVEAAPLITTIWVTSTVAVGAVRGGRLGGTIFGAVVGLCNYLVRGYVDTDLTRDMVLLVGIGFGLGLTATMSRRSAERLAAAVRTEAATAERERLARNIHDSVLQVLARVRKRGNEIGGDAAELAELAGEQEVALRSLVASGPVESSGDDDADLRPHLQLLASGRFQVSVPATPVTLPPAAADELAGLVREALTNVSQHAGPDAKAWVLLEDLGDEVVVSVRDDGHGIPAGRLDAAEREGRMGVARSIRGRVNDLGGTITLETAPGAGTEWEVRVPRNRKGRRRHG